MEPSPIRIVVRSIDHDGKSLLSTIIDEIDVVFGAFAGISNGNDNVDQSRSDILTTLRKIQDVQRYIEHQMELIARGYDIGHDSESILQLIKAGILRPSRKLRDLCATLGPEIGRLSGVPTGYDSNALLDASAAFEAFVSKLVGIGERIVESRTESVKLETEFLRALADIRKKHLGVAVIRKGKFRATIKVNRGAVYLLFRELISNAFKYSHESRSLEMVTEDSVSVDGVHLKIADNGMGMAPEDCQDRIFKAGVRLDAAIDLGSRKAGSDGRGLGLSIVKSIVTSMGGRIAAQSELDRGSEFQVFLPVLQNAA